MIHRSTSELNRLLLSGHDVNGNQSEPFPPLAYALGWLPGMNLLLKAGAKAYPAIYIAIRLRLVAEVEMLLQCDCPLFELSSSQVRPVTPLLEHVVSYLTPGFYNRPLDDIVRLIFHALAKRRRQLMDLANEKLSSKQLDFLPLQTRRGKTLLDKDAALVVSLLEAAGVTVPSALGPGRSPSIYHYFGLTVDTATELYDLGFHSIDVEDSFGITPALICCCEREFELLFWFLDRGARINGFLLALPPSLAHALALVIAHEWGPVLRSHRNLPVDHPKTVPEAVCAGLKRIGAACSPIYTDTCNCPCSSYGCLPVVFLFKAYSCSWRSRMDLVTFWLDLTDAIPCLLELSYMEICRLEIFERLGMAHICCQYDPPLGIHEVWSRREMDPDEEKELCEEDEHFKIILDAYMQLYKDLRKEYSGPFTLFWDAWWEVLDDFLPEPVRWRRGLFIPAKVEVPRDEFGNGEPISSEASYGLDGQIRDKVRSRLGYHDDEDLADIFSDSMTYLFHDVNML